MRTVTMMDHPGGVPSIAFRPGNAKRCKVAVANVPPSDLAGLIEAKRHGKTIDTHKQLAYALLCTLLRVCRR